MIVLALDLIKKLISSVIRLGRCSRQYVTRYLLPDFHCFVLEFYQEISVFFQRLFLNSFLTNTNLFKRICTYAFFYVIFYKNIFHLFNFFFLLNIFLKVLKKFYKKEYVERQKFAGVTMPYTQTYICFTFRK